MVLNHTIYYNNIRMYNIINKQLYNIQFIQQYNKKYTIYDTLLYNIIAIGNIILIYNNNII